MFRRIGFWLTGICTIIFVIYFFSKEQFTNKEPSAVAKVLSIVTYPVELLVLSANNFIFSMSHTYNNLKMTGHEAISLESENIELKVKMKALNDLVDENNRLRNLLALSQRLALKFISADVINRDPSFLYQNIQINKGRKNNVQIGMGVLNEDGVVGIVMHVTDYFSDVILLTDPNSSFDAMITRNKKRGVLHGGILNKMQFKYFDNTGNILVGDEIVTSGITGSFPSGIPIGKVSKVQSSDDGMSQFVEVVPAVDVSYLSNVLVLLNLNKEVELIKNIEGEEWMEKNLGTKVEK